MWDARDRWRHAEHPYGYPSHLQIRVDELPRLARWMLDWSAPSASATSMRRRRCCAALSALGAAPARADERRAHHGLPRASGYIIPASAIAWRWPTRSSAARRFSIARGRASPVACRPSGCSTSTRCARSASARDLRRPVAADGQARPQASAAVAELAPLRARPGRARNSSVITCRRRRWARRAVPPGLRQDRGPALWQLAPAGSGLAKRSTSAWGPPDDADVARPLRGAARLAEPHGASGPPRAAAAARGRPRAVACPAAALFPGEAGRRGARGTTSGPRARRRWP